MINSFKKIYKIIWIIKNDGLTLTERTVKNVLIANDIINLIATVRCHPGVLNSMKK